MVWPIIAGEVVAGLVLGKAIDWIVQRAVDNEVFSLNRAHIQATMSDRLDSLPSDQGMLIGFIKYRDTNGSLIRYGPVDFGNGSKPIEPIQGVYDTNKSVSGLAAGVLDELELSGLHLDGIEYYWTTKVDGEITFSRMNSDKLMSLAFLDRVALESQAAAVSESIGVSKTIEQDKLFNKLEAQFKNKIEASRLRSKLMSIRSKIIDAQDKFIAARNEQQSIIARAQKVSFMQQLNEIAGVVGSLASAAETLSAKKAYQSNVVKEKATVYNTHVNNYHNTIIKIGVSPDLLPKIENIDTRRF